MKTLQEIFVKIFAGTTWAGDTIPQHLIDRAITNFCALFIPLIVVIIVAVAFMIVSQKIKGEWKPKTKICYLFTVFIVAFAI